MGGWKTRAIFERYNVRNSTDQRDAANKLEQARAEQAAENEKQAKAAADKMGQVPATRRPV